MCVCRCVCVCVCVCAGVCVCVCVCVGVCDRICKKGSHTCTTSEHRFHHHSIDTSSDNPRVHALWPTVHQSAFAF